MTFFPIACSDISRWQKELGLLVNFGLPRGKIKRVIFEEVIPIIKENYVEIKPLINHKNRETLKSIRAVVLSLVDEYGLGYKAKIYQDLLRIEFSYRKIKNNSAVIVPVAYEGKIIRSYKMNCSVIGNQILCGVVALQKDVMLDILKVQTYLRMLNLPIGLLIHFGKKELQIFGVRP